LAAIVFLGEFWGGKVTSEFLYMSIFLAFAYLNPNYELLLFFIIPVKVKYLAWFDVVFTVLSIIFRPETRITALLSFTSFVVFFFDVYLLPSVKRLDRKIFCQDTGDSLYLLHMRQDIKGSSGA